MSDQELLQRYYSEGNTQLLGILLERYTLMLYGVGMKYLKSEVQAEDMVQQVFLKTLSELPKYRIENFGGWLYFVAKNYCLSWLRQKQKNITDQVPEHLAEPEGIDEEALWQKEADLGQLKLAIEKLKPEQRISIQLFYLERKSYQQISDETGFDLKKIKSHIQNGKRNLRLLLTSDNTIKK